MLRQAVGWSTPALALVALFGIQFAARRDDLLSLWLGILLVAATGLVVGTVAEYHGRLHAVFGRVGGRLEYTLWILPCLLVWGAGLAIVLWRPDLSFPGEALTRLLITLVVALLNRLVILPIQSIYMPIQNDLPLFGALLVGLCVFAQNREIAAADNTTQASALPRQLLSLLTYLAAFGLFTLVYQIKERSLISATTTAFVSVLLSLVMLRGAGADRQRTLLYAALIGVAMGEVTWALNYWVVRELVGGAVLLLIFYVVVGLIEVVLRGELNRRLLAEYLGVGIVGFLFILSTAPWRP